MLVARTVSEKKNGKNGFAYIVVRCRFD